MPTRNQLSRQAKNRSLEIDAAEIRMRAERRVGELIISQKETVGLNAGSLRRGTQAEPRDERPALAEAGIDKKLSSRAQKLAAVPEREFEGMLGDWRERGGKAKIDGSRKAPSNAGGRSQGHAVPIRNRVTPSQPLPVPE